MDEEKWSQFFGYKNHMNIDARYGYIRSYEVTAASTHDSKHYLPKLHLIRYPYLRSFRVPWSHES
ncbi:MAG: transposase, partial [Cyanobacteria bacterium J06639_1]